MNEDPPTHSTPSAPLAAFLQALSESGDVAVEAFNASDASAELPADTDTMNLLADLDRAARDELSGALPAFDAPAALAAARFLYCACQFLVCRDVPAETVTAILGRPLTSVKTSAVIFSVDGVLRHLPDLHALANRLAPGDALVEALRHQAREWPLSSVGIELSDEVNLGVVADDPVLFRLYVDRVSERAAKDRLHDPRVKARLRADAGLYPELVPFPASAFSA